MAWVKLDDQFFHNRKARAVGPEGRELFVASVCYAAVQLNDGTFVAEDLPVIAALAQVEPSVADRLVRHDLWHPEGHDCAKCRAVGQSMPVPSGHIAVHEYLKDNKSRHQLLTEREKDRQRKASRSGPESDRNPPVPSRPVPDSYLSSSRPGNSQANGANADDDEISTAVPDDVWTTYAELKLAQQTNVRNAGPWKTRTANNARTELAEQAQRWWNMFDLTPRRLAECLVDGTAPRTAPYRKAAP